MRDPKMELVLEKYNPVLVFLGTKQEQEEIEEKENRNERRILSLLRDLQEEKTDWITIYNGKTMKVITRGFLSPFRVSTFCKLSCWEPCSHFDYQEEKEMLHGYNQISFKGRIFYHGLQ